jgi:hypothetical protein
MPLDQLFFLGFICIMVALTVVATVRYMWAILRQSSASNRVEPSWFSTLVRR